jgi:shikimate dehydrogenase
MSNAQTDIYAVIGNPISHSLSPKIHNAIFNKYKLNCLYSAICIDYANIKNFILSMKTLNIKGVNVTVPFKETLVEYLDKPDSFVTKCGAVNTIINNNGVIYGYNTDGIGFLYVLEHVLNLNLLNKKVVVLGAGGTAKSIGFSLISTNIASLSLINRSSDKVVSLLDSLQAENSSLEINAFKLADSAIYDVLADSDIIINTTSVGMSVSDSLLLDNMDWVNSNKVCIDVIYNPNETLFLKESRLRGAKTLNGVSMLAAQAMYAAEYFTYKKIDYKFILDQLKG